MSATRVEVRVYERTDAAQPAWIYAATEAAAAANAGSFRPGLDQALVTPWLWPPLPTLLDQTWDQPAWIFTNLPAAPAADVPLRTLMGVGI